MENQTKRNHIVPKFYLKNFCDSNGWIYQFDRNDPENWLSNSATNPKKVAVQTSVYPQGTEDWLGTIENEVAPIIRQIIDQVDQGARRIPNLNSIDLAKFVISQLYRNPDEIKRARANYEQNTGTQLTDDMFFEKLFPCLVDKHGNHILKYIWFLLDSSKIGDPFITSDMPIGYIRDEGYLTSGQLTGVESKGIGISCPLTPRLTVMICEPDGRREMARREGVQLGNEEGLVKKASQQDINGLNCTQLKRSKDYIYSSTKNLGSISVDC